MTVKWCVEPTEIGQDRGVQAPIRVAYTFEQCWHRVPGGTASAAIRAAVALGDIQGVELVGVAGTHRRPPEPSFVPPIPIQSLPFRRPLLYETWLRFGWPHIERATGPVDVLHCTGLIPAPSKAPLVVTLHDVAWRHRPDHFTRHGVRIFERSLVEIRRRAEIVLCPSTVTMLDAERAGIEADRLRMVPLGVESQPVTDADIAAVRAKYSLPGEYLLFVGTVEPRKNLRRLVDAMAVSKCALPLVVAGSQGWGETGVSPTSSVHFIGFVADSDLPALYSSATAFCYPSEREGFGMPVLEAMSYGTPVVTSLGASTEEVAGGAAVLVDPFDVEDIARGIDEVLSRRQELSIWGLRQAARRQWSETARLTVAAYREVIG
jgi:glycosyltransferase involved in cell wall biosynthesis